MSKFFRWCGMNMRLEEKILFLFELLEVILLFLLFIIFTLIFRLELSYFRYLFLLGDLYVIYSFSKTLSSFEKKFEKRRILKNSNLKIQAKYLKKISF